VAKKAGLAGKTEEEELNADIILEHVNDFNTRKNVTSKSTFMVLNPKERKEFGLFLLTVWFLRDMPTVQPLFFPDKNINFKLAKLGRSKTIMRLLRNLLRQLHLCPPSVLCPDF